MRALFLDRDGVINENLPNSVTRPEHLRFLPGAIEALVCLARSSYSLVLVTNQAAVGRGRMTMDVLDEIHAQMLAKIRAAGGRIDAVYLCAHRPEDECSCRKPRPDLLRRAAGQHGIDLQASFFIGDALTDIQAAHAAGCQPILVLTGRGRETLADLARLGVTCSWVADDLRQAAAQILALEDGTDVERQQELLRI
jgi:D-glycero-D-manno-heptose 1,7-bisphosphate phosphatase